MAARNWIEGLHVSGAFSDRQAPTLNRALRNRGYEALVAWRRCNPDRAEDRFMAYLCDRAIDGDAELPRAAVSGAVSRAVDEFATAESIDPAVAAELQAAAVAGAQSAVESLLRFDEHAQRQVAHLVSMIPGYWEAPEIGAGFRVLLEGK